MDIIDITKKIEEFNKTKAGKEASKAFETAFNNWLENNKQETENKSGIVLG